MDHKITLPDGTVYDGDSAEWAWLQYNKQKKLTSEWMHYCGETVRYYELPWWKRWLAEHGFDIKEADEYIMLDPPRSF